MLHHGSFLYRQESGFSVRQGGFDSRMTHQSPVAGRSGRHALNVERLRFEPSPGNHFA